MCVYMVPKNRAEEEVNERAIINGDVNSMADSELKMLDRIITGNEMWCYLYDPQTRRHSYHPDFAKDHLALC